MRFIAQDLREYMARLGVRTVDELVGRSDLLKVREGLTGRQAEILNSITRFLRSRNSKIELPEEELKELVGHTPFQVAVGSAIGIIVGLLIH